MKYIKALIKWVFRKESLGNALFAIRIANMVLQKKGDKKTTAKTKKALERLKIAQSLLDHSMQFVDNKKVEKQIESINKDKNKRKFGPFDAEIDINRHGEGNHGIELSTQVDLLGKRISMKHDFADGNFQAKLGNLELKI